MTVAALALLLAGCGSADGERGSLGPAPMRGFGISVDEAVAGRLTAVHLRTCGPWGCHDQDVPLMVSGPTSPVPCGTAPDDTCGVAVLPGPGPGYGHAPVPPLTFDPVTVRVTTPAGAGFTVDAEVTVTPRSVQGTPQARLRIAADGTVSQG